MSPAILGFVRGIGVAILMAVLLFLSNAMNLHGILPDSIAAIISGLALMLEHAMSANTGKTPGTNPCSRMTMRMTMM